MGNIKTIWELRTYDVWGNAKDGYEVNDVYKLGDAYELYLHVEIFNKGKKGEFKGATPSDVQIRRAFGLGKIQIETDGDDVYIIVDRRRDGYPLGEMRCISHESLSPIREKERVREKERE